MDAILLFLSRGCYFSNQLCSSALTLSCGGLGRHDIVVLTGFPLEPLKMSHSNQSNEQFGCMKRCFKLFTRQNETYQQI